MKKMGRVLAVIMTLVMLLAMLPASAMAAQTTTNGTYTNGTWTSGGDGSITHNVNGTNVTLSKTAAAVAENVFDITLQVQTSTTSSVHTEGGAVVLVIDLSNSMKYCADCGGDGSHFRTCDHYSRWNNNNVTTAQNRLTAAKNAALDFLESYAGTDENATRQLSIVAFATSSAVELAWENVAGGEGKNSYDDAVDAINDLAIAGCDSSVSSNYRGGTNLEAGLYTAKNQLSSDALSSSVAKNVILLTDGIPTFRLGSNNSGFAGDGSNGSATNNSRAETQADSIKSATGGNASLYTVCFGVADDKTYDNGPTVGDFLKDDIASPATEDTTYAYNADNTTELNNAFKAITESINSGLSGAGWTATDPMGDLVSVSGSAPAGFTSSDGETYTWTLSNPTVVTNGNTTTYTYTITYRVTLDVLDPAFQAGTYYPTNDPTYLNIGDEQYAFPVPGVQGQKLNFVLHKIDETNKMPLSGVDFTLTHTCGNNCTSSTAWGPYYGTSDANGAIAFADASGNALNGLPSGHTYTLTEAEYEGYQPNDPVQFTVSNGTLTETEDKDYFYPDQNGFVMENIPYTSATVVKVWDDANDQDGKRPDSLTVTLSNGQSVTLTAANNWTATIEELPYYAADGSVITYTWTEGHEPEGYKLTNTSVNGTVTTLTNTHVPEVTSATVTKVWDDADNQDGKRPESLSVTLSNGQTVTLNETNEWTATIDNLPVYANGQVITYTWTEGAMPEGYSLTNTSVNGTVTTLTNSYTPETTSVSVAKVWDDADNQDGKRPESLTVTLSNGQSVILNAANNWTATIDNLPVYANGQVIEYTWNEEALPEGYELTNTAVNGYMTTLTNSYEPETTGVSVAKVWDDANNQDGKRPTSLNVTLSNGQTVTLNEGNGWTATIDNLPVYANGQVIEYTWIEEALPEGYALTNTAVDGYVTTLTNSYEPEETSVTVTKVWDDADNQDGKRPESLTVTLSNGQTVTLNETNEWTATIENLPVYENGSVIEYTWTEGEMPEGYMLTNTSVNGTITTLTNSYEPEETSVTVTKVWDDADNQDGKRPESLTVTLSNGQTVTLNEANEWTATIENLPVYENGSVIEYTWTEGEMPEGYMLTNTSVNGTITTLTNSYEPEETSVTVTKVWDDANNQDGKRPESLTVTLSNGQTVTLNETNEWTATIENLPVYENGSVIEYTWTEGEMPEGYVLTNTSVNGTITTLTNSYEPEETSVTVTKVWDDADNQDGKRPESLTVTLSNGQIVTLNEANSWTATIENLPVYENGSVIEYTWTEGEMPEGYVLTNTSVNGTITTLTNSYTPETTSVSVAKVWDDADNQDGKRPESLTVTLSNGQTVTLNEVNEWTATIENLPVYENGSVIEYTWTEGAMPEGYVLTNTSVNGTITTLTNSYEPEETSVTVTKVWDDADNQDGKRPESLTVTLSNGQTVTLNETNEWTATIENLPVYENGSVIEYTWTEGEMPEGYVLTNTSVNGTITTLTNSYEPEVTTATVTKVWDDANNQDGKRPESLTVTLSNGQTVTLNEANSWTATLNNLPVYENGQVITYTWTEGSVPAGYVLTNTSVNGTITTLTNSYEPELTTATVVKVWDDANDQDGMRPDELLVELSNGTRVTLNVANSWTATVENLPAYANGALINYTWSEVNVPEGYSLTSTSVNGTVTTLTNSHVPGVNTISGSKTWVDNNNQDHQRPDSITIYLLQNGTQIASQTVTAEDGWSWTFTNLPLYENGVLITYSIQEAPVEHYTATYNGYNVTNTYHPVTIDIPVQKIWIDDDNQRGKRPAVITVGLLVNGLHNGQYIVLDESNGWAGMFYDLPLYQNGVPIQYGVFEAPVDGYISDTAGNNHDGFVVVNQIDLTPPKTGDNSNIALWLALMSASALCFVLISKRRSA